MVKIETYIFIDLETTGLPSHELNRTRITEVSMLAVKRDHLLNGSGSMPRVQHKLTLCLHPRRPVSEGSTEITGLSNFLLEYEPEFNERVFSLIDTFINVLTQPVCLVAYNGFNFDYPILQNHLAKLKVKFTSDVLCADGLHAFYDIENGVSSIKYKYSDTSVQETTSQDESDFYKPNVSMQQLNETTPKAVKRKLTPPEVKLKKCRRQLFPWNGKSEMSYKLVDVYRRVVKKPVNDAHRAECDCMLCLEIVVQMPKQFIEWVDNNHKKFSDIAPMCIGVPLT